MLRMKPPFQSALAGLLAASLLLPAAALAQGGSHAGHNHGPPPIPADAGPVEALFKQRQYEAALRKADELKAAGTTDAENEYWAARALRSMKRADEAAERFRALSKTYPNTEKGASADVDAIIAVLGKMPEAPYDAAAKAFASEQGQLLLGVAKKHEKNADVRARALYIAGNAFRMAQAEDEASAAYGACRGLTEAHDTGYPDKCTLGLATIKARTWQEAEALALYRECALQDRDANTAKRCSKSLARTQLVGLPAPELELETQFNTDKLSLAEMKGNVVMPFFFATWCPHCKQTLPTLPTYTEAFEGQPFKLVAITNNVRGQTTEAVSVFIKDPQWKIDYPVGVDARGATTIAMEASGIPQVILIDKKGVVRWSDHPAYLKTELIETLLAEPGGA